MEHTSIRERLNQLKRKQILIGTITGDNARLLEIALDKGFDIKFEKDEESGEIRLLAE